MIPLPMAKMRATMAAQSSAPNCRIRTARAYVRRDTAATATVRQVTTTAMGTPARDSYRAGSSGAVASDIVKAESLSMMG